MIRVDADLWVRTRVSYPGAQIGSAATWFVRSDSSPHVARAETVGDCLLRLRGGVGAFVLQVHAFARVRNFPDPNAAGGGFEVQASG